MLMSPAPYICNFQLKIYVFEGFEPIFETTQRPTVTACVVKIGCGFHHADMETLITVENG